MNRPKTNIRCFNFDEDGRPRLNRRGGTGCEHGYKCYFVHPDEAQWKTARLPKQEAPRGPEDFERPGRGRHRSPTPPRSPRLSGRRDPDHFEGSREREHERVRRKSVDSSNTTSIESRSRTNRDGGPRASNTPHISHMPPPPVPTPSVSAVLPSAPPPPLPPPTAPTATVTQTNPPAELTIDERKNIWKSRIQLMADCVAARTDHLKLQRELSQYEALLQSWRFSSLPDEDKGRLRSQVTEARDRCATKKAELNELIKSLINTDYWPVPKDNSGLENVRKEVRELKELCANVRKDMMEVIAKQAEINLATATATAARHNDSAMDVDDDGTRSKGKRRRLSDSGRATNDRSIGVPRRIQEQIEWLEERLGELENVLIQRDAEVLEELDSRVEARLEEMKQLQSESSEKERVQTHEAYGNQIENLEKNLNTIGNEVGQMAVEIAALITESEDSKKERDILRRENEEWKRKYVELEARYSQVGEVNKQQSQELQALSAAMAAHSSRTTTTTPQIPPLERLAEIVQQPALQLVDDMLQTNAEDLRNSLSSSIQKQNSDIHTAIFPKLSKLSRLLQVMEGMTKTANSGNNVPLSNT
ncbi:hypothetical protein NEOLEDRAFT_1147134 [Neolentinus lepideus HHB14362 ss-1]|uniref:C3H1-type domain-containing protein n=1 Tax=Neolentinus lepideus HHB14362 ss-1 TaxID=1314782 RepID=A0A165TC62_9AGAM|nr:hypothetical protein NEOLEDRAFT_1147134 [Neolentinus lepideus HHB14362 ss-1]